MTLHRFYITTAYEYDEVNQLCAHWARSWHSNYGVRRKHGIFFVKNIYQGFRKGNKIEISKRDWKLFREKVPVWQENYMEKLIKEYVNFLSDDTKPASSKFWELEKRIKEDRRHPGVLIEMRKSEAVWDIMRLMRLKVITYEDLEEFSDTLKMEIKRILEQRS